MPQDIYNQTRAIVFIKKYPLFKTGFQHFFSLIDLFAVQNTFFVHLFVHYLLYLYDQSILNGFFQILFVYLSKFVFLAIFN